MQILFDQGTPVAIRRFFAGHTVRTTRQEGWSTLTNGHLLRMAEEASFDLLLTTDNSLAYQQNLKDRKIAIVVLSRNGWRSVQRMIPEFIVAVNAATPGSYAIIEIPVRYARLCITNCVFQRDSETRALEASVYLPTLP